MKKIAALIIPLVLLAQSTICSTTFYVNAANPAPASPYTNWVSAATNIQDAVNLTTSGDTVLVTNGVYAFGGRIMAGDLINRVALTNAITVQSVNGPWATTILGAGAANGTSAVRCAWLTNGAALVGFTLMSGATRSSGDQNSLQSGGGVWCASTNALVTSCVIKSNTAYQYGAAIYQGTVAGSYIIGNQSSSLGGAAYKSVLNNCTIVSNNVNYAVLSSPAMTNCIIYFNTFQNYSLSGSAFSHCCTTPALSGTGNFTTAPQWAVDGIHLLANSSCIGAGVNIGGGTDILGATWSNTPAVGCVEWTPLPVITAPQVQTSGSWDGIKIGNFACSTPSACNYAWVKDGTFLRDNGHFIGTQTTNLIVAHAGLTDGGNYWLVVSNSYGAITSSILTMSVHCVDSAGINPVNPYSTWATAATTIQDAINVSAPGDVVLVTNGVYSSGGTVMAGDLTNRVALNKPILVASVNGWSTTVIQGAWDSATTNGPGAVRCACLTNGAALNGFTLENGATRNTGDFLLQQSGGGVFCYSTNCVIANCLLTNNSASYSGGGTCYGTIVNSLIIGNQALYGGGAADSTLNNCTVLNNAILTGSGGGGTYDSLVLNSIVFGNYSAIKPSGVTGANNYWDDLGSPKYYYSCAYTYLGSLPSGRGNINASDSKFIDLFHLSTISPCYGTGNAAYASGFDMDGEAWNIPPSMGCDEIVPANLNGPLTVSIYPGWTNALVNRSWTYLAIISGRTANVTWSFGDGPVYTNYASYCYHQWTNAGIYTVTATAFNNDNPAGVSANLSVQVQPLLSAQLQSAVALTNGFQFQFAGQTNATYVIQYATNLVPPVTWNTLNTIYYNIQPTVQVLDSSWTNGARFYRVLTQ